MWAFSSFSALSFYLWSKDAGDLPSLRSATSPAASRGDSARGASAIPGPSPGRPLQTGERQPVAIPATSAVSVPAPYESKLSTGRKRKQPVAIATSCLSQFAEEGGFEPPIPREGYTGFRDQRLQPLGHPSLWDCKDNTKKQTNKKEAVFCNWLIMSRKGKVPTPKTRVGTFYK